MTKTKAFVLTACHNEKDNLLPLLSDLAKQSYKNIQVIVVDADSHDGTPQDVNSRYPDFKLISVDSDQWWTGSIKAGVDWVLGVADPADYLITINADCRLDRDFVGNLISASHDKKNALIGSTIIDQTSGQLVDAAVKLDWKTGKFSKYLPHNSRTKYLSSDVLSTKGTLFPVKVFLEVGNFDAKHLPHYLSDYEFSLRANRSGYKLFTCTNSYVKNLTERTGIGQTRPINLTLRELWNILFSRRSRLNLIDHLHFIKLSCPKDYLIRNYIALIIKSVYLVLSIYPLGYLTSHLIKYRQSQY